MDSTDRIEKQVTIRAPVPRVWRALIDSGEFGRWFGVQLDGEFVAGRTVTGTFHFDEAAFAGFLDGLGLPATKVKVPDPHAVFCTVERIEPERCLSFTWIPFGIDAEADRANEPTTLVEFRLSEVPGGTQLTIVESGFGRVPAHRRERAYRMNLAGWTAQAENVKAHVERS